MTYLLGCAVLWAIYFLGCALLWGAASEVDSFRRKAESGDAEAQFALGLMYDLGVDVPKNYAESGKWYLKAAEQGLAEAQFKLGVRYFEYGKTARENYTSAFTWFYKAANQGVTEAQFNVALMYQLGRGVPTNKVEAYKWFNIASAQGFPKATAARDILGGELSRLQIVEAEKRASAFTPKRQFRSQRIVATDGATPKTSGTGFFITSDGYLVTNYHVVEDAENLSIKTRNGLLPATLIKSDITNDLALLKVSGAFRPLPLSRLAAAQLGQAVFTIGFPNPDMQGLEPKLTRGEISSLAGMKDDPRHFQISVPVQPGNSGGPLVDLNGNVVGVVSMRMGDLRALKYTGALPQNVNYAIKASVLSNLVSCIPDAPRALRAAAADSAKFEDIVKQVEDGVALILGY
jgi:S1-C subfamily serine protease